MPTVHPFGQVIEAGDIEAAIALLAPDVHFRSPVVYRPYQGSEAVGRLLRAVDATFEDLRYVREIGDARDAVLVFEARVGDREVEGADFIQSDAGGRITDLVVMVRPMSGMHALAAAMKERLEAAA